MLVLPGRAIKAIKLELTSIVLYYYFYDLCVQIKNNNNTFVHTTTLQCIRNNIMILL